jgi:hypothetical protein
VRDNIEMDLREIGWGMDLIRVTQDRDKWRALVIKEVNLRAPYLIGKFLSSSVIGGFSRMNRLHGVKLYTKHKVR